MMIVFSMMLLMTALLIAEFWSVNLVWAYLGGVKTILLLFLGAVLGAGIARKNAKNSLKNLLKGVAKGNPGKEMFNAMALFSAAALFIFPGFFTDILALILFIPFSRSIVFFLFFANSNIASEFSKGYQASSSEKSSNKHQSPFDNDADVVDIVAETVEDSKEKKLLTHD